MMKALLFVCLYAFCPSQHFFNHESLPTEALCSLEDSWNLLRDGRGASNIHFLARKRMSACSNYCGIVCYNQDNMLNKCMYALKFLFFYVHARQVVLANINRAKIVSGHAQEIPQSQTADNPVAPQGRAAQPSQDTRKTN